MKPRRPIWHVSLAAAAILSLLVFTSDRPVTSQSRERTVSTGKSNSAGDKDPGKSASQEVVKVDVDLVTVDALVLEKKTARIVGGLKREDFQIYEDGAKQQISHFSQDSLPLSVLLLIDRGGCLDPFGDKVRRAAREAIERLKPVDEVAIMTYHNSTQLLQGFTKNR